MKPRSLSLLRLVSLASLALVPVFAACGASGRAAPTGPFTAHFPNEGPGTSPSVPPEIPPPTAERVPTFDADAVPFTRTALFGSFPSDVFLYGETVFTTDADAVESDGALVVPIDVSGGAPVPSTAFATVHIHASDLVTSLGAAGDPTNAPGFGFYLNDLTVVSDDLGFVLANAAGSDSVPNCSNLVVFNPTTGVIRQVVNLANPYSTGAPLVDSTGVLVPGAKFIQAGAEGVEFVPTASLKGLVYVAMPNFVFGAPSNGAVKYPGTIQVFDVDPSAPVPVTARAPTSLLVTQTIQTVNYNPVAISRFATTDGHERLLVTVAGTTAFNGTGLVPVTNASVDVYDGMSTAYLGTYPLGLAGLSGIRPALGRDSVGHAVGFYPSSVTGEVYLVRLDGFDTDPIDGSKISILRGVGNGIPIDPTAAGGPGGNVTGVGLSPNGRTLVVSGFGNLFAFPSPKPGRLLALSLPENLVTGSEFGSDYLPGTTSLATAPGRTLGALVLSPHPGLGGPDVYVAVGGAIDLTTYLGAGPASLGSLTTYGLVH